MKKQGNNEKAIRNKLYEVRRQSRERHLKFMGVDVKKFRELERDINKKYGEVIESLQKIRLEEGGEERAKKHEEILEMRQKTLKTKKTDLQLGVLVLLCGCDYTNDETANVGNSKDTEGEITIDPSSGGTGTATVNYDETLNQAQPFADVSGGGTGTINSVQINTWYRFSFFPASDDTYCILPSVIMNGWWLLWTWGGGCGTSVDPGSGRVWVKLKVRVDQLSATVKEIEHTVLDQNVTGGGDGEGAVDYVSDIDGGAGMTVQLQGGHEAVVFVECEVYVQITNFGRAIIDMQRGRGFYFRVPSVAWGRHIPCYTCRLQPIQCVSGPLQCGLQPGLVCASGPTYIECPPNPVPGGGSCEIEPIISCLPGPDPVPYEPMMELRKSVKRRKK
jgi:hypothetical protein